MTCLPRCCSLLLVLLCLLGSACETAPDAGPETTAERPNILFIFTDDHSARALSAYGSTDSSLTPTSCRAPTS